MRRAKGRKSNLDGGFFLIRGISFLFLGWNFDDAWLIYDASGAVSLLNNTDDPSLISFLLLDVLAVSCGLFAWQTDQKTSRRFRGVALQKLEHVSTGLSDSSHFRDDRQVVNDEGDFVLLMRREGLSVTKQTESSDVSGSMSVVLVHQARCGAVQASHRVHRSVICFADVFFGHDQLKQLSLFLLSCSLLITSMSHLDTVPTFRLLKPLMSVDCDLRSERLCKHQHVSHDSIIGNDVVVGVADGRCDSTDCAPWVDDALSSSD